MSTNEFARILLTWIKSFLSWIGIPRDRLNELDEIIFLILIVVSFPRSLSLFVVFTTFW